MAAGFYESLASNILIEKLFTKLEISSDWIITAYGDNNIMIRHDKIEGVDGVKEFNKMVDYIESKFTGQLTRSFDRDELEAYGHLYYKGLKVWVTIAEGNIDQCEVEYKEVKVKRPVISKLCSEAAKLDF